MEINKEQARIILAYIKAQGPMENTYVAITNEEYQQALELKRRLEEFIGV